MNSKIRVWLGDTNGVAFTIYAIIAAFCTYSCMYAFRKPFGAAGYAEAGELFGLSFKSAIVIAQVIGYAISKFMGIKVVSEMGRNGRAVAIIALILIAELALLGFALVPIKFKIIFLFANGLPLGMVWGLVFSFLEGRRFTEVMGAGLCASFAFASGFVKSIGKWLMLNGVSDFWMPVATGAIFIVPLLFFVWMLSLLPDPTPEDEALRTKRAPMDKAERYRFFKNFGMGMVLLVGVYMLLTAFRDFRDNFMAEILTALGHGDEPEIFTITEIPVTLGVLALLGLIMFIKDNKKALMVNHIVIGLGLASTVVSTWLYQAGYIDPIVWIMLTGFGTYMAYIPFNCILFERLIAAFKYVSNVGFLIYVADSFGYLASVGVLFYKDFGQPDLSWLQFFIRISYSTGIVGIVLIILSMIYFKWKLQKWVPVNITKQ